MTLDYERKGICLLTESNLDDLVDEYLWLKAEVVSLAGALAMKDEQIATLQSRCNDFEQGGSYYRSVYDEVLADLKAWRSWAAPLYVGADDYTAFGTDTQVRDVIAGKLKSLNQLQGEQIETLTKALDGLAAAAADLVGYCDNCGGTGFIGGGNELPCAWCTPTRQALTVYPRQEHGKKP